MKWWPFGKNSKDAHCEDSEGCEDETESEDEVTEEYLQSLPACIRNNEERLRRAKKIDRLEAQSHQLFDSQIGMLREIRARLTEPKKG